MNELSKRATIYFNADLHHALRLKAATTQTTMSEIVNNAARLLLCEDEEDLSSFEDRASEPVITYDELLRDLKKHGKL